MVNILIPSISSLFMEFLYIVLSHSCKNSSIPATCFCRYSVNLSKKVQMYALSLSNRLSLNMLYNCSARSINGVEISSSQASFISAGNKRFSSSSLFLANRLASSIFSSLCIIRWLILINEAMVSLS